MANAGGCRSNTDRIADLRALEGAGVVTALKAPDIAALAASGPLQLLLFGEQNLAEIKHPDDEGERLVACRNPAQAEARRNKRESVLSATEEGMGWMSSQRTMVSPRG